MVNSIINGDCLEVMKDIPDGSVDLICCDLPYGTTQNSWDSVIELTKLWGCYERIIKPNGAIILTAQTPFDKVLGASNLKLLRYEWVWEKDRASGHLNAKKAPMKAHENILVFYKKLPTYNPQKTTGHKPANKNHAIGATDLVHKNKTTNYGNFERIASGGNTDRYPRSVVKFNGVNSADKELTHPTQKPVALWEYLIKTYSNKGDIVLDNCSGSGTNAIACINTGRKYICIEREQKYYDASVLRVEQHLEKLYAEI